MTTNDTPDLDAVIAELEKEAREHIAINDGEPRGKLGLFVPAKQWLELLSAAKLAQELTALLGPEPAERAKVLVEQARALAVAIGYPEEGVPFDVLAFAAGEFKRERDEARAALAEKEAQVVKVTTECDALREALDNAWRSIPPHELVLHCPNCGKQHLDIGEFATRVHRKHLCENTTEGPNTGCGHLWVPFPYATKGVEFTMTQAVFAIGQERDRLRERVAELERNQAPAPHQYGCECVRCMAGYFRRSGETKA